MNKPSFNFGPTAQPAPKEPNLEDFRAYLPTHQYVYLPTGDLWPAIAVNACIAPVPDPAGGKKDLSASLWLDRNRAVQQLTWAPGEPREISGRYLIEGGWSYHPDARVLNLYRPPRLQGIPGNVQPWLGHIKAMFGADGDHVVKWLAHRVQYPSEKINHALVLGGKQGIGKDTLLEPVKQAIGPWNFREASPSQMLERFNGFLKAVILRVSEARDLGDVNRYAFYDHAKTMTAAPPDVLRIDEKHIASYAIPNIVGVVITTNHKTDGIYLPPEDRRHFVAWSDLPETHFGDAYFRELYEWYAGGGIEAVADYLQRIDLSGFNPKAPPPKTQAFFEIVAASFAPEDAELTDAIEAMGQPAAFTLEHLRLKADPSLVGWLDDRRNGRALPHRLEECGYIRVQNRFSKQGLWRVRGKRQAIYAQSSLPAADRLAAADRLRDPGPPA